MKYVLLLLLVGMFGCSASYDKTEAAQSIAGKIGVKPDDISYVSKCYYTIPDKRSQKGDWRPCFLAETNESIHILSGGRVVFTGEFSKIQSVGFPKSLSSHEVQLFMADSLISFQLTKSLDFVDDDAGKALFDRVKSKGIEVNHDATKIIHGH